MTRPLPPFTLHQPTSLPEAVALVAAGGRPLMGGATLLPLLASGADRADTLVSLNRVPGLDELFANPKVGLRIGARVRAARLLPDVWTGKRFAAIHEAVEQLDAPFVGNSGSVVGNICALRPDYDMAAALMALNGVLQVTGPQGARTLAIRDLQHSPLAPDEIVTAVHCPGPGTDAGSAFKKLDLLPPTPRAPRKINVAATVTYAVERERVLAATLVIGGHALPHRLPAAERLPLGEVATPDLWEDVASAALAEAGLPPDAVLRAQARALMRDALAQANARALARHDHFDDTADLIAEQD